MYQLGTKSLSELNQVHPDMVEVVKYAITITEQDFTVYDGIRTAAEQNALYKRGASQRDGYNRKSEHQIQETGYGHAVDLVPYVPGRGPVWDWDMIYPICDAMVIAAKKFDCAIRWGGCWGHESIHTMTGSPENWVQDYVRRKQKAGKRAFNDGPHYELLR